MRCLGPGWRGWGTGPSHVLTAELEIRQKREQIPARTLLLAVEDPEVHVGSGGATLNALLVAAEHLSARAGFTVSAAQVPPWVQRGWGLQTEPFQGPQLFGLHFSAQFWFGISFCICRLSRLVQVRAEGRGSLCSGFRKSEPVSRS